MTLFGKFLDLLGSDVRIAIVKAAYLFLAKNTEKGVKVAWKILLESVDVKKQEEWKYSGELLTALLGATPGIIIIISHVLNTRNPAPEPRTVRRRLVHQANHPRIPQINHQMQGPRCSLPKVCRVCTCFRTSDLPY